MTTPTADHLTQRLMDWYGTLSWTSDLSALIPVLLTELARAEPVNPHRVAARAGLPAEELIDLLRRSPAEWDAEGRLVGFGLTLRPTRHRFEVDGRLLYTWCGPDALGFPTVIDLDARIESPCFSTGQAIRIELGPAGVRKVEPDTAVVSFVTPKVDLADFRHSLCQQQHFFSSADAASEWKAANPDGIVVSIPDGVTLTRRLFARWLDPAGARPETGSRGATEEPIACTLTPDAMIDRLAFLERLRDGLIAREATEGGLRVRLRDTKDVERRTRELIAAESSCCSFLTFRLDRAGGELILEISGPDHARPIIDHFFAPAAA